MKIVCLLSLGTVVALCACQNEPEAKPGTGASIDSKIKGPGTAPKVEPPAVTFAAVQGILKNNCVLCHSGAQPKEQLDLSSYATLMKGSEHGPVIVAGDPENSMIVHAIRGEKGKKRMPPAPAAALSEADIKTIVDWIQAGAKES